MDEPLKKEDEIYCPGCAKPIKKDFTICPYCRTEINQNIKIENKDNEPDVKSDIKPENELKPKYSYKKDVKSFLAAFFGIVIVVVILVMCNISGGKNSSTPTTESEQSKQVRAFVCSQTAVEKNLKAPSTAKFPYITDSDVKVTKLATDKYSVSAFVDSQNGFGAMIRSTYTVTITFTGEDTYKWEDLNISE